MMSDLKKNLTQLSDIQKETKELEVKIKKLQEKEKELKADTVRGSSKYFPYGERTFSITGVDIRIHIRLKRYQLLLEKRHDELLEQQIKTEEFINQIPDSRMRRILKFRYIEQFTWIKTASSIGGYATSDSVRIEHDRFLEKN